MHSLFGSVATGVRVEATESAPEPTQFQLPDDVPVVDWLLLGLCSDATAAAASASSFYGLTGLEHTFTAFTHYGLLCSKRGHGRVYQLAVFSLFLMRFYT